MSKFGIGVGEEFPVRDAAPRNAAPPEGDCGHRYGRWHRVFHWALRLTFLALMVSAIVFLLRPHEFGAGFHGPYAFHPGHHHVFFPILLIVLLALFAWRRGGGHHRHWHHHPHRDHGEGA